MNARHITSLTAFDTPDDWLLSNDDVVTDPMEILILMELEHDAELAGFDSVDDYLHANPDVILN